MVNFTFLANPVFSESGSGMAVAGTVAGSCTGGLVAVSIVAVLFGGVALGVGYYAYKLKVLNAQLRRNQELIAVVGRHQRAASSIIRMREDFEDPESVYGPTPRGGVHLPSVPRQTPMMARPRMATPNTSFS